MALIVALSMFLIMGVAMSAMIIGRQVYQRRELQTAADSAVLAAAHAVQQRGLPFNPGWVQHFVKNNSNLSILSAKYDPVTWRQAYKPFSRRVIRLDLNARFLTWQKWLPTAFIDFSVRSHAQFNEQWFGDRWPMMYFLFDASNSMEDKISGGWGQKAWDVLKKTFLEYAKYPLPARNGVIIFDKTIRADAPPLTTSSSNLGPIKTAMNKIDSNNLVTGTATADAFDRAAQRYKAISFSGKNAIMLSDGPPTYAKGCTPKGQAVINAAIAKAKKLRSLSGGAANLISAELRTVNTSSDAKWKKLLIQYSGAAGTNGNDTNYFRTVASKIAIEMFLDLVTRSICKWGPINPAPGALPDAYRLRSGMKDPSRNPQRLFVFLWDPSAGEMIVPKVSNASLFHNAHGFEYHTDTLGSHVILSRHSCTYLGSDPRRRVIVRWDQPQLARDPTK